MPWYKRISKELETDGLREATLSSLSKRMDYLEQITKFELVSSPPPNMEGDQANNHEVILFCHPLGQLDWLKRGE